MSYIKKTILIVEDNFVVRKALNDSLLEFFDVVTAENGEEGLAKFFSEDSNIDLIVTDLRMPIVDGITLIKKVKSKSKTTPIIAITGYGEDEVTAAANAKADEIYKKPFDVSDLYQSIKALTAA